MLKQMIKETVEKAVLDVVGQIYPFEVQQAPKQFGDFATNAALVGAKYVAKSPMNYAEQLRERLLETDLFESVDIAKPGFINFKLRKPALLTVLKRIVENDGYPISKISSEKIQFEYGSANPTGPFTVGHGRQLVIGDVLSNVFKQLGYDVTREMYINDAGRQIKLLGRSLWVRYNQLLGVENLEIPQDGYHGEYLIDIAKKLIEEQGEKFKEKWDEEISSFFETYAVKSILEDMKHDLNDLGCTFDVYYSEKSLIEDGTVNEVLKILEEKGYTYWKDGALWFKVSELENEEDKVLIKKDGSLTYFLTDIAYHYKKYKRGFAKVYDIWGSDHHGHIPRMRAAMKALGLPDGFFNVILHQFVTLKRGQEIVRMSTRAGEFVTLRELMDEVGVDATRYFFAMIDPNTHMIFDLNLAKAKSMDNPVYYVQYAHARICSLFEQAKLKNVEFVKGKDLELLGEEPELDLIRTLDGFEDALLDVARTLSPNKLTQYLEALAYSFHTFYTKCLIVDPNNPKLSNARLNLSYGTLVVLKKGLQLLGVSAPEKM
ncbi:arginine--tRNA ligase [Pseudothermotoga thermarum]|uniref:Arginine--tRNA ligase n=1 Tax=Pseudothermotoga thermarum DSM 5069 TaxID=688269 RepID=F7YWC3_9THEM|nr:arginyl-tRNA synthetase [Pseudothermotoga thermarum DSM 5069]